MKIGILGAALDEIDAIKSQLHITDEIVIANRTFYSGKLNNIDVVLVFSRWGKTAAASTVTTLINVFHVDFVLFTGVAGAVDPRLNIGDIVIGQSLYHHDMDARPFFQRFETPLTGTTYFKPANTDIQAAEKAAQDFVNNITSDINPTILNQFSISKPTVYTGMIASGDKFVSNTQGDDAFKPESNTVLAVEMEGAAVAQVCEEHDTPYVIIRTISDRADHQAHIDFPAFIKEIASHYSLGIVRRLIESLTRK